MVENLSEYYQNVPLHMSLIKRSVLIAGLQRKTDFSGGKFNTAVSSHIRILVRKGPTEIIVFLMNLQVVPEMLYTIVVVSIL